VGVEALTGVPWIVNTNAKPSEMEARTNLWVSHREPGHERDRFAAHNPGAILDCETGRDGFSKACARERDPLVSRRQNRYKVVEYGRLRNVDRTLVSRPLRRLIVPPLKDGALHQANVLQKPCPVPFVDDHADPLAKKSIRNGAPPDRPRRTVFMMRIRWEP
jgi:hypothetical protein